jgi:phosphinothricin acetyltransferase
VDVRLARLDDAEAIRAIYNVEIAGVATFDLVERSLEEQQRWLGAHSGAHPAVVAVDAGVADEDIVVGFGSLSPVRDRPAYSTTVEDSVYVDRAWQGRGVGKALLEELLRLATGHGFHSVIARIVGDNEASIRLHRSCGFDMVGVEREVGRKLGRWLDVVEMQVLL